MWIFFSISLLKTQQFLEVKNVPLLFDLDDFRENKVNYFA